MITIDFDQLGDTDERARLLAGLATDGFVALEQLGLTDDIAQVYEQSRRFHALPDVDKQPVHNDQHHGRGWVPLLTEPAYVAGTVARCESFDLAKELGEWERRGERGMLGPNIWPSPDVLADFQPTVYGLYEHLRAIGHGLLTATGLALGLDDNRLADLDTDRSPSMMRLLHYPPGPAGSEIPDADIEVVGISAHTDYEALTLMHSKGPGLQLRQPAGEWVDAPDGRVTVIVGDMLERITNGRLLATPHRVLDLTTERSSIILFCALDAHIPIAPFPELLAPDEEPRYEPTTQSGHIAAEVAAAMERRVRTTP